MKKIVLAIMFLCLLAGSSFGAVAILTQCDTYQWNDYAFNGTTESKTLNTKGVANLYLNTGHGTFTAEARWLFDTGTKVYSIEALGVNNTALTVKSSRCVVRLYTSSYMTIEAYLQAK